MGSQLGPAIGDLAGLGDQATSVGLMILIRRGEDLITLVIPGVFDGTPCAKSIYGRLNARAAQGGSA